MSQEKLVTGQDDGDNERRNFARGVLALGSGFTEEQIKEAADLLLAGNPDHRDLCLVVGHDLGEKSLQAWNMLVAQGVTKKDITTLLKSMEHMPDLLLRQRIKTFVEQHPDLPEGSDDYPVMPEEGDESYRLAA